jgi:tetratricopeptide (TPR) repeat protein
MRPFPDAPVSAAEAHDHAHWDAAAEASELLHEQRYNDALVELHHVLDQDARNPYALHMLGVAFYETGQLEPARDAYRACLRVAPAHLGARVALTHVLRALGDLRGAIEEGTAALGQAPDDADVLYALGMAHLSRGDRAAARRVFEAFLDAGPEFESYEEVKALLEAMDGTAS